jgi:outer membrane protein TolC
MHFRIWLLTAAFGASAGAMTLREAEQIALRENPQVMMARLAALAAERATETGPLWAPRIDLLTSAVQAPDQTRIGAQPGAITNPIIISHLAVGAHLNLPITDFGRSALARDAARERAAAQREQSRLTRAQVVLAVRQAYWGLWRAQQLEKLAGPRELDLALARNNRLIASMELATLLGRGPGESLEAEDSPDTSAEIYDLEEITRRALRASPALEERRCLAEAAAKAAKAERRAALPAVSLVASAGVVPVAAPRFPGSSYRAAGILVSMPVLPWQPGAARREEAEMRWEAAEAATRDLENRVAKEVAVAVVQINSAAAALAMARSSLAEAATEAAQAQARSRLVAAEHDVAIRKAVLAFHTGVSEPE